MTLPAKLLIILSISLFFRQVLCLFPFAAYQWFAYAAFCRLTASDVELSATVKQYGADHGLKMPGDTAKPDWCRNDPPISYFSVQSMSWPADDEQSTKGIDIMVYSSVGQLPYLISSAPTLGECKKMMSEKAPSGKANLSFLNNTFKVILEMWHYIPIRSVIRHSREKNNY
jgi:hypothetical protein